MTDRIPVDKSIAPSFDYDAFELPENVALNFHFGPRLNANDLPDPVDMARLMRETDILVPDIQIKGGQGILARIAMGNTADYRAISGMFTEDQTWHKAMLSAIYGSRVVTTNIDIPDDHPAIKAYNSTKLAIQEAGFIPVRQNFDQVKELVVANLTASKAWDQSLLQNLKPELERTIGLSTRLQQKRELGPIAVSLFYGSAHSSLIDGVLAKNDLQPTQGFSATGESSVEDHITETVYGKFLRGQEITVSDVERLYAYHAFSSFVVDRGYFGAAVSGGLLVDMFKSLEKEIDIRDIDAMLMYIERSFQEAYLKQQRMRP